MSWWEDMLNNLSRMGEGLVNSGGGFGTKPTSSPAQRLAVSNSRVAEQPQWSRPTLEEFQRNVASNRFPGSSGGGGSFGTPEPPRQQMAPPMGSTDLPDFMSFLRQAMDQVGGVGSVNYDPLRNNARQRGTEYDARLEAMYNQLAGSLRNDAKEAGTRYQGAIDQTADRTADTQQSIQMASNVADDRNAEVLRNLGIEAAQGNIVQGGRDLNTQTAGNVADAAARGQIAGDALQRNQQSSVDYSNGIAGAAGLEGNLQQARVQSELSNLLAQYDMQEQEANRQAQQQSLSQSMGLAGSLYDDAWRKQGYNDDMSKWLYEQQQAQNQPQRTDPMQYSMNFISQLMQNPEFQDLDIDQILKILGPAASIGKLAN